MLVEINLLPKKEKANPRFFLYLILLLLISLMMGALFYWQYFIHKDRIQSIDKQILQVREATATVERDLFNKQESGNSATELERVIKWADSFPIDTVFVLQHLTSLLPKRGFFDEFTYKEDGSIELAIQFDASRQAANYLTELTKDDLIASATLDSVKSVVKDKKSTTLVEEPNVYLPRYLAVYTIHLNESAIKEKDKKDGEQGGSKEGEAE